MRVKLEMGTSLGLTTAVHEIAWRLPRHRYEYDRHALPQNGIYLFFERGEQTEVGGAFRDRIVRVGTHREDGRFSTRIRQHYGQVRTLRGNKNGSVFRRHVGGALLRKLDPADARLPEWARQGGQSFVAVEEEVSRRLREEFTFVCFEVPGRIERLELERGLIALLAQHPVAPPSSAWLGRNAGASEIRETGLWNTQHCRSMPLTPEEFELFRRRATGLLR